MSKGCIVIGLMFGVVAAIVMGGAWVFEHLWNAVVPSVFNGPSLGYWQAFGLWALIVIIAGAFRSSSSSSRR